jgi:hypothetical protein
VQQAAPVATATVPKRAPRKRKDNGTMVDAAARAQQQEGVIAAGEEGQPEEQPTPKRSRRKAAQEG